jgi:CRISPR-associated endonuclease/helicase Cas3
MPLSADQFANFFQEIHGRPPFPWQAELARRASNGEWPDFLAVPTGCGKTAAIDAAIFALALQATLPPKDRTAARRIFYVVNRRIIVDEAFKRAQRIAEALARPGADKPTVAKVAEKLRAIGGADSPPLECVQLRGGVWRDNSWARSITQPLVVCTTVDQIGSRLLFRGYGVSPSSWPIHAALAANDALFLLDEAHISRPFKQTLSAVKRYRSHKKTTPLPFDFVQMTATPPGDATDVKVLRLSDADRANPILANRLSAAKPAALITAPKGKLVGILVAEALNLLRNGTPPRSLAVMVNRVATAKEVFALLSKKHPARTTLLIGRMRPLDRDDTTKDLQAELRTGADNATQDNTNAAPRIVVSTQCLEVGADFDFDALVTECAPLDALRQRFGRLNRAGRQIPANATIVSNEDAKEDAKKDDPIYGSALINTWEWLKKIVSAGTVDFGINALAAKLPDATALDPLLSPTQDAPVLLPAHLDALCQTSPEPAHVPEPALFLHGPRRADTDVQICWRDDLPQDNASDWAEILALAPPSSLETLPVPIGEFRRWLLGEKLNATGDTLDVIGDEDTGDAKPKSPLAPVLVWRGADESFPIKTHGDFRHLRPGDTLVLAADTERSNELGHLPNNGPGTAISDLATLAYHTAKHRLLLRISPALLDATADFAKQLPDDSVLAGLLAFAKSADNDIPAKDLPKLLNKAAKEITDIVKNGIPNIDDVQPSQPPAALVEALSPFADAIPKHIRIARYPGETGIVITAPTDTANPAAEDDTGNDDTSNSAAPVSLEKHLTDVRDAVCETLAQLPLADLFNASLANAAALHDIGKADERFQATLLGGDINLAWAQLAPLAKSARIPASRIDRARVRRRAKLPDGFRHELLSVQLLEHFSSDNTALLLHLIAAHHGHARPFAPVVIDTETPPVEFTTDGKTFSLDAATRAALPPPHRLDSGVAERFWALTHELGWWHLAYLETVLRLADRQVSASYEK